MASSSDSFHEPYDILSDEVRDRHRAIVSLMEELEAVDWYDQRIAAASDPELRDILAHNRDEEKEHAAMVLEWLRRHDEGWAAELSERLFRDGAIVQENDGEHNVAKRTLPPAGDGSLGIGSLKETSR